MICRLSEVNVKKLLSMTFFMTKGAVSTKNDLLNQKKVLPVTTN